MINKEIKSQIYSIIEDARYDNKFEIKDKTLIPYLSILLNELIIDQEKTTIDFEMLEEHLQSLENKIYYLKELINKNK